MNRYFIRHYVEMVVVMFVGMGVLWLPLAPALSAAGVDLHDDAPALMLLAMATTMTVPMVGWMLYRGHGWLPAAEMAGAMFAPTFVAVALLGAGLVTDAGALMLFQHVVMLPAMFAVMLVRRDEYAHA
jgi:hypothetical protein